MPRMKAQPQPHRNHQRHARRSQSSQASESERLHCVPTGSIHIDSMNAAILANSLANMRQANSSNSRMQSESNATRAITINERLASIGGLFGAFSIIVTGALLYAIFTAKPEDKWFVLKKTSQKCRVLSIWWKIEVFYYLELKNTQKIT